MTGRYLTQLYLWWILWADIPSRCHSGRTRDTKFDFIGRNPCSYLRAYQATPDAVAKDAESYFSPPTSRFYISNLGSSLR